MEDVKTLDKVDVPRQTVPELREIDVGKLPGPVLARLIEEVRNEEAAEIDAYSRFHNRHNRSR